MEGTYLPLQGDGELKEHICAFTRRGEGKVVLVIVPRFLTRLLKSPDELPLGHEVWGDSRVVIPREIPTVKFKNILTGEVMDLVEQDGKAALALDQVFANFPVALLEAI
jgi:(1->4)-alpha-D-glucan 1-alpha-D-glucosylmutase